ncbi:MAG: cell wall hydrolase [Parvibaculum sp.]|nr:cell wall hydrolase [Parvibaculum sp.]
MSDKSGDIFLVAGIFAIAWAWLRKRGAVAPSGQPLSAPPPVGGFSVAPGYENPFAVAPAPQQPSAPVSPSLVSSFFGSTQQPAAPAVGSFGWPNFTEFAGNATELDVLARTLFGEAASEARRGIEAVAAVIINRVADRRWPSTARGVCLQDRQFSLWNVEYRDSDQNSIRALSVTDANGTFRVCLDVAQDALSGRLADPTGGAHHYYAPKKANPPWKSAAKSSLTIGNHIFLIGVP